MIGTLYRLEYTKKSSGLNWIWEVFAYTDELLFSGKTLENVRNRKKMELNKQDDDKVLQMQSTLTLNGVQNSCEIYDGHTYKQKL